MVMDAKHATDDFAVIEFKQFNTIRIFFHLLFFVLSSSILANLKSFHCEKLDSLSTKG